MNRDSKANLYKSKKRPIEYETYDSDQDSQMTESKAMRFLADSEETQKESEVFADPFAKPSTSRQTLDKEDNEVPDLVTEDPNHGEIPATVDDAKDDKPGTSSDSQPASFKAVIPVDLAVKGSITIDLPAGKMDEMMQSAVNMIVHAALSQKSTLIDGVQIYNPDGSAVEPKQLFFPSHMDVTNATFLFESNLPGKDVLKTRNEAMVNVGEKHYYKGNLITSYESVHVFGKEIFLVIKMRGIDDVKLIAKNDVKVFKQVPIKRTDSTDSQETETYSDWECEIDCSSDSDSTSDDTSATTYSYSTIDVPVIQTRRAHRNNENSRFLLNDRVYRIKSGSNIYCSSSSNPGYKNIAKLQSECTKFDPNDAGLSNLPYVALFPGVCLNKPCHSDPLGFTDPSSILLLNPAEDGIMIDSGLTDKYVGM